MAVMKRPSKTKVALAKAKSQLVGKNYSPIVAKAQSERLKKTKSATSTIKPASSTKTVTKKSPVKKETKKEPVTKVRTKRTAARAVETKSASPKTTAKPTKDTKGIKPEVKKTTKRKLTETTKPGNKKQKTVVTKTESTTSTSTSESPKLTTTTTPTSSSKVKKGGKKTKKPEQLKPISNIRSLRKRPSDIKVKRRKIEHPDRGVCMFSHVPHGFYEDQMKSYCSQFGKVTGVYHPVSKRGNSRGYAFVEFEHKEVAQVVADTMNNYLMFKRLVKCVLVPQERQRSWVFKLKRNNHNKAVLQRNLALKSRMRQLSPSEEEEFKKRKINRVKNLHKKLSDLGLDYEFQVNIPSSNNPPASEEIKS